MYTTCGSFWSTATSSSRMNCMTLLSLDQSSRPSWSPRAIVTWDRDELTLEALVDPEVEIVVGAVERVTGSAERHAVDAGHPERQASSPCLEDRVLICGAVHVQLRGSGRERVVGRQRDDVAPSAGYDHGVLVVESTHAGHSSVLASAVLSTTAKPRCTSSTTSLVSSPVKKM